MSSDENAKPIRVFIHLSYYFGTNTWQKSPPLGINDRLPYGYYRAAEDGCLIVYSEDDRNENRLERRFRIGVKSIIGVDLVHAWRNRKGIYNSDIVWTFGRIRRCNISRSYYYFRFSFGNRGQN
jgi:hypothetical protein